MKLLHWCTLSPQGPSNLAAVRFNSSIRVSSLRVFPTGSRPFKSCPDVVAETEPEAFFFDVFFNALPADAAAKEKNRPQNALVPTTIAYAGGQIEFAVDMGPEYITKLMIVKGDFRSLSLAIYGEVVSSVPEPVPSYEPREVPAPITPFPLSKALDPANMRDPTSLATELLSSSNDDAPPLSLVTKLIFCLKPLNEDWDLPEFPYLYADLDGSGEDGSMEELAQMISTPIHDDASEEQMEAFVKKVQDLVEDTRDAEMAYQLSRLLSASAAQIPRLTQMLMKSLDIPTIFDGEFLTESTLLRLLEASSNPIIASHFNSPAFLQTLNECQSSPTTPQPVRILVRRLISRVHCWTTFQDALSNTRGDFADSARLLCDVGLDEGSIGIWLISMITHEEVVTKLGENPVLPSSSQPPQPPALLEEPTSEVSHDEFINFTRAYIGVAGVLAVWAWADSLGHDTCREQALAILHLWQGVDGYREVVNHLLLLRQLTRRLEWITTDNDPPRRSGGLAEQVLLDLSKETYAFLRPDFVQTILSLKPPLSVIAEHERLAARKIALVAEEGLASAVEELLYESEHPLSLRRLKTLRVSLAIVKKELQDSESEWDAMKVIWDEGAHGLIKRLTDILIGVANDLNGHFILNSVPPRPGVLSSMPSGYACPPKMNQTLAEQLFKIAEELISLITQLVPSFPLNASRELMALSNSIADIFASTDGADMAFMGGKYSSKAANGARRSCIALLKALTRPDMDTTYESAPSGSTPNGAQKHPAQVVLHALLDHASHPQGRDPAYHLTQTFMLIDSILPQPDEDQAEEREHQTRSGGRPNFWVTSVLPNLTHELVQFFKYLELGNRLHLLKRLVTLDSGVVGIGEWLVGEELTALSESLDTLKKSKEGENTREKRTLSLEAKHAFEYQVTTHLKFLDAVLRSQTSMWSSGRPSLGSWMLEALGDCPDVAVRLANCLQALYEGNYRSLEFEQVVRTLAKSADTFTPDLNGVILLCLLKTLRDEVDDDETSSGLALIPPAATEDIISVLDILGKTDVALDPLRLEIGRTLGFFSGRLSLETREVPNPDDLVEVLHGMLRWLSERVDSHMRVLPGISIDQLSRLLQAISQSLPQDQEGAFEALRAKFTVEEDDAISLTSPVTIPTILPSTLSLSVQDINNIMRHSGSLPSTPRKGTKTPDILGLVISPPTALLRSPAATGLTKTYTNNDFRQLRQIPSARQNTSRLPSTHGDF
ncbi:hypothetical protein BDN72DRAFT_799775 [Pluteus cervinus]|uniref:Uncharacterized protein n=1 Tax=Pluteus cervinus TaxID=181527 RepID=A0ACD3ALJ2_9AGAR|nr:hypothetical protein BDN72DRAFT_799775 [Pluteus cervinus]